MGWDHTMEIISLMVTVGEAVFQLFSDLPMFLGSHPHKACFQVREYAKLTSSCVKCRNSDSPAYSDKGIHKVFLYFNCDLGDSSHWLKLLAFDNKCTFAL